MFAAFTRWLSRLLAGRQWQESSFRVARNRDHQAASSLSAPTAASEIVYHLRPSTSYRWAKDVFCICGDPKCDLPWSDGGRTA